MGLPSDPPFPQPTEGLYHPRFDVVPELETYFGNLGYRIEEIITGSRPVIGFWFFPIRRLDGHMAHVDTLIAEIEKILASETTISAIVFGRFQTLLGADATQNIRGVFRYRKDRQAVQLLYQIEFVLIKIRL